MSIQIARPGERRQDDAPKEDCTSRGVSSGEDVSPLSISYLRGLVSRQLPIIVAVALAVGLLCTLLTLRREPQFTATTLLLVDGSASALARGDQISALSQVDTQVELLRAVNIVERLAVRLKTANEAKPSVSALFFSNGVSGAMKSLGSVLTLTGAVNWPAPQSFIGEVAETLFKGMGSVKVRQGSALESPVAKVSGVEGNASSRKSSAKVFKLQSRFKISRRGLTDVIAINAKAETPERAAELANLYAEVYLDEQVAAKLHSIERVEVALAQRIEELKADLARVGTAIALRETYLDYLSRLKQVRQRRSVIMPDMRIAAPALPLRRLAFPSSRLLLVLSWMLAIGLAVGVALLRDRHYILQIVNHRGRRNI